MDWICWNDWIGGLDGKGKGTDNGNMRYGLMMMIPRSKPSAKACYGSSVPKTYGAVRELMRFATDGHEAMISATV